MNNQDNISPKLKNLSKELPFKVPRGYFDDFPARMQHRLELEKQAETKPKTRIIELFKPVLSLAAGFAAIFILVYWPIKTLNNRQTAEKIEFGVQQIISVDFFNIFENIDEHTFYALLENDSDDDVFETESLVAFLSANYSDYDVFIESQK
jgi:hypothetical protein